MTLSELQTQLQAQFGNELIFTNCHDDVFNFEGLIDFMQQRQKIVLEDGYVRLNKANICSH